jgi:4-alpha-glucanotransferase
MAPTAHPVRLCLALHNHQPVGNFDDVFEAAYQDSYLPFLDVYQPYESIKLSLHISGSLIEWLDAKHPEYLDRIRDMAQAGRIEILGGAFYEPILTMIPSRDRIGQISTYTHWLKDRLHADVRGVWMPERVWEACLTKDLAAASIEYTILDDFHFRSAGCSESQLTGYFVTEDEGRLLRVFPGSEKLRYLIPFAEPQKTIDYLRELGEKHPGIVAVFGDDGEKFGTWPDTKVHVYDNGWLKEFFDLLTQNQDWLTTWTLAEAVDNTPPAGKVYLPNSSYREMTEWSLPVDQQIKLHDLMNQLDHDERGRQIQPFIRGGFWRNFKVRYDEANEMYARMMHVSSLIQQLEQEGHNGQWLNQARLHLYRGQCNCAYWHGAFGGLYLPHLRNAVYRELIIAESEIDRGSRSSEHWVEAHADDYDFDGHKEIKLANPWLAAWFAPVKGGRLYELDLKKIGLNLLATMQRRPEAYHEKVKLGGEQHGKEAASIHDRVVFKQEGLDQRLQYDARLRKSMVDYFWQDNVKLVDIETNVAQQGGDFCDLPFQSRIRRSEDKIQVHMQRKGNVWGTPVTIEKALTLFANSDEMEIAYMLDGLPKDRSLHFAIEFNFAGMPPNADDRFFEDRDHKRLGHMGARLDLKKQTHLALNDHWQGINVALQWSVPTDVWTFPIETVSQSEAGFELVHQSTVVMPHWQIKADKNGRWVMTMKLACHALNHDANAHSVDFASASH